VCFVLNMYEEKVNGQSVETYLDIYAIITSRISTNP